ncbi:MAG TPA: peptidyl-prolyl cis-trans isomerase [Deferrimonas sp.]
MFHCRLLPRIALAIILLSALLACKEKTEAVDPPLVRIDGRVITLSEFKSDFERTLPAGRNLSLEERGDLERAFLIQAIDRELTLAEAERLGIEVTAEEHQAALQEYQKDYPGTALETMLHDTGQTLEKWRDELGEGLLMEKVVRQAVYSRVSISDDEIDGYYRQHREEFDRPAQVRARQIVVGSEAEGQRILGLLRQGEDFAEIARKYSLSPDSEAGGDLGFFSRGQMPPEFDAVVFTLPVNRLSDLIKSEYGYHIFRVEESRKAVRLTLGEVRDEIREQLRATKEEQIHLEWLQNLRERATIEVNWNLL